MTTLQQQQLLLQQQLQQQQSHHIPLAKCRVLYLGSSVPLDTVDGMDALQTPLRQRYVCSEELGDVNGIDSWLKTYSTGVMLTPVADATSSIWFPIQHLKMCAAVKCLESIVKSNPPRFVAVDSNEASSTKHPPLFACVMRRTTGVKVLECHVFLCKSDRSALELVRSCVCAHDNRDGWTDEDDIPDNLNVVDLPAIVAAENDVKLPAKAPATASHGEQNAKVNGNNENNLPAANKIIVQAVIENNDDRSAGKSKTAEAAIQANGSTKESTVKKKPKSATPSKASKTVNPTGQAIVPQALPVQSVPMMQNMMHVPGAPLMAPMVMPAPLMQTPIMPIPMAYEMASGYYAGWNNYGTIPYANFDFVDDFGGTGKRGKDHSKNKNKSKKKDTKYGQTNFINGYPTDAAYPSFIPMPVSINDWRQGKFGGTVSEDRLYRDYDRHSDIGYYDDRKEDRRTPDDTYYRGNLSRHSDEGQYRYRSDIADERQYRDKRDTGLVDERQYRDRRDIADERQYRDRRGIDNERQYHDRRTVDDERQYRDKRDVADESQYRDRRDISNRHEPMSRNGHGNAGTQSKYKDSYDRAIVRDDDLNIRTVDRRANAARDDRRPVDSRQSNNMRDDEVIYAPINKKNGTVDRAQGGRPSPMAQNNNGNGYRDESQEIISQRNNSDAIDFRSNFIMQPNQDARQSRSQNISSDPSARDLSPAGSYARHIDIDRKPSRNVEQQFRDMFVTNRTKAH